MPKHCPITISPAVSNYKGRIGYTHTHKNNSKKIKKKQKQKQKKGRSDEIIFFSIEFLLTIPV